MVNPDISGRLDRALSLLADSTARHAFALRRYQVEGDRDLTGIEKAEALERLAIEAERQARRQEGV
ncbi:MAG: hypothetical protein GF355_07030 [Candidatus Eisenbacteria bacterium]|nr:hypothetical protein [Candidatus Eisenbacteria bacterium]